MEIVHLVHLQALDIVSTGLKTLPVTVGQLRKLMRLCIEEHKMIFPSEVLGKLTSLEELNLYLNSCKNFLVDVGKLTALKKLKFLFADGLGVDEGSVKAFVESLKGLHRIKTLDIVLLGPTTSCLEGWEPPRQLRQFCIHGTELPRLPAWMNSMWVPHLSILYIDVDSIEARDLDMLARLPSLHILGLNINGRFSWTVEGGRLFPHLRRCMTNIELKILHGAMQMLSNLRLSSMYGAVSDFGLGNLPLLNSVEVRLLCKGATARQVEEVEAAWRHEIDAHPNRPSIQIHRFGEEKILATEEAAAEEETSIIQRMKKRGKDLSGIEEEHS